MNKTKFAIVVCVLLMLAACANLSPADMLADTYAGIEAAALSADVASGQGYLSDDDKAKVKVTLQSAKDAADQAMALLSLGNSPAALDKLQIASGALYIVSEILERANASQ